VGLCRAFAGRSGPIPMARSDVIYNPKCERVGVILDAVCSSLLGKESNDTGRVCDLMLLLLTCCPMGVCFPIPSYLTSITCIPLNTIFYEPPAALFMKKFFNGPIASTALRPKLLSPTIGPDSTLYNRCNLSHTPSIALFAAYRSLV
jgi:hypothetical protein